MQRYSFDITVPSESAVLIVMLDIINIDDNAPIIHMIDRCEIPVSNSKQPYLITTRILFC